MKGSQKVAKLRFEISVWLLSGMYCDDHLFLSFHSKRYCASILLNIQGMNDIGTFGYLFMQNLVIITFFTVCLNSLITAIYNDKTFVKSLHRYRTIQKIMLIDQWGQYRTNFWFLDGNGIASFLGVLIRRLVVSSKSTYYSAMLNLFFIYKQGILFSF